MAIREPYGTLGSPDTIRALASIFEHELDFEFIPIDLDTGEHKTESFLSLSVISSEKQNNRTLKYLHVIVVDSSPF